MTFSLHIRTSADIAAAAKEAAKADIKARRDSAITSGITVAGLGIATDDTSQTRIMGAAVSAMLDEGYSVQWKTEAGFVTLDASTIITVAQAVRAHVQACFDREAVLLAALEAGEPHDVTAGWP